MKKSFVWVTALAVAASVALSGCAALTASAQQPPVAAVPVTAPAAQAQQQQPAAQAQAPAAPLAAVSTGADGLSAYQSALEQLYQQISPSVVNIHVWLAPQVSQNSVQPFGLPQQQPQSQAQEALASGFVWDSQGNIVTNNHVVENATDITVTFPDGTTYTAKVVGTDPDSDLAVIKADIPQSALKPVTLGNSNQVQVGQAVIAIGNPFGLEGSMSTGIVSAVGRDLPAGSSTQGSSYTIPEVIQTDASINPGNSGGVLVNSAGQVIGVTSAIISPVQASAGVGFAIPSAIVAQVVPQLIANGHFDHPYIGISGTDMTLDIAQAMKLNDQQRGALVVQVMPGGPAEQAGLLGSTQNVTLHGQQMPVGGDVIIAIDGQPIKTFDDVVAYLSSSTTVGQKVTLTVLRNGQEKQMDLTLGTRPTQLQLAQTPTSASAQLGIQGMTLTSQIAQAMNLPSNAQGVLVVGVQQGSAAAQAGLEAGTQTTTIGGQSVTVGGDIIVGLDGHPIDSIQTLQALMSQLNPGDQVILTIVRSGQQVDVPVILGGSVAP